MPVRSEHIVLGVIADPRNSHQPPFDAEHLHLISDSADHAALALALASARSNPPPDWLADRERIGHDLHDHVIQRLFAAGLDLQGIIARLLIE